MIKDKCLCMLVVAVLFVSCTAIGEYYTDVKDDDVEYIQINTDRQLKSIGFAANIIGSEFNGIIFFKLIDTVHYRDYQIKQIYLQVNNASDSKAEKKLLCIDAPQVIRYEQVEQIPELKKRVHSGLPLQFFYTFNKGEIGERDKIKVSVKILVNENGKDTVIETSFEMRRHTRYKSKLVSS